MSPVLKEIISPGTKSACELGVSAYSVWGPQPAVYSNPWAALEATDESVDEGLLVEIWLDRLDKYVANVQATVSLT